MTGSHTDPLHTLLSCSWKHSNPLRSAQGSPSPTHMTPSLGLPLPLISLPLLWVSPKLLPHPRVPPENRSCYRSSSLPNPRDTMLPGHSHFFLPKQLFLPSQHRPTCSRDCISRSSTAHKTNKQTNKLKTTFLSLSLTHSLPNETFIFLNHPPTMCHSGSRSLPPFSPFPEFSRRLLQPFAVFFYLPSVLQKAPSKHSKFSLYPLPPLRPSSIPLIPPYLPFRTGHPK